MTLKPSIKLRELAFPLGRDGLHAAMLDHVKSTFGNGGIMVPTWIVQISGTLVTLETDWTDDREKQIHVHAVEDFLIAKQASGYSFACEAWVSSYSQDEMEEAKRVPPSQRAKRDDILMVSTQMRNGDSCLTRFMVMASGTPRAKLGVQIDEDWGMAGGTLMNLFNADRPKSVDDVIEKFSP